MMLPDQTLDPIGPASQLSHDKKTDVIYSETRVDRAIRIDHDHHGSR